MKKIFIYSIFILTVLFAFSIYEYYRFSDGKLHLVMCDVGQGEAIFITLPTKTQILIDGGPGKAVLDCLSRNMPFWDRSIDVVILTHPHADHHAGLIDVIERYSVNDFYSQAVKSDSEGFKLLEAKLADKKMSAKYLKKGDNFSDKSGAEIRILWPENTSLKEMDQNRANDYLNESSILALLSYGNFSALLTGDAEKDSIDRVFHELGRLDVFKIPHHGSEGAVNDELLINLNPDVALISVGENNKFGHPSAETLDYLKKYGIKSFRTDEVGEIEIISDKNKFEVSLKND